MSNRNRCINASTQEFAPPLFFNGEEELVLAVEELGMPNSEITIAEMVKKGAGYQTGQYRKWHPWPQRSMLPHQQRIWWCIVMASGLYLPADDPNTQLQQSKTPMLITNLYGQMMSYAATLTA